MLRTRTVFEHDGIEVSDVACRHESGRGEEVEHAGGHYLVFVRRGCFVRSADGEQAVLDPTLAYCMNPGEEQRYDHPHGRGDDCTTIRLPEDLVASLWGGDPALPSGPLPTAPDLDLAHRALLADARDDAAALAERALELTARALERRDARRVASGRPATARARGALADGAREALAESPHRSLPDLARLLAVSPHHLSRVFRAHTGHTIARHRMRLRAREALERLARGEDDLARLALDLGFADQPPMTRVLRAETGATPAALRREISGR
jgi:AraC-like DNA-binding protein